MIRTTIFTILILAAARLLAQGDAKLPQGFDPTKAWMEMQQQFLRQFDANRDGKLTGNEQLLAQEAMRRQGINLGMAPGGSPAAEQFSKQFDRDGDGKLSPGERAAAQAAYQRIMNGGKSGVQRGGGVSSGGVPSAGPAVSPGTQAEQKSDKIPPLVKRFDKDGDGKLNAEEKAAAQAELKKAKSKEAKAEAKEKDGKEKAAKVEAKEGPDGKGAAAKDK